MAWLDTVVCEKCYFYGCSKFMMQRELHPTYKFIPMVVLLLPVQKQRLT